jgi:plastocyanin
MPRIAVLVTVLALSLSAQAADNEFTLVIQDHKFEPKEIVVPTGKKVKLIIENRDASPEEFESRALNREKIIAGKSKATIFIGPLKAGQYPFVGEFNEKTAQGVVVAQ